MHLLEACLPNWIENSPLLLTATTSLFVPCIQLKLSLTFHDYPYPSLLLPYLNQISICQTCSYLPNCQQNHHRKKSTHLFLRKQTSQLRSDIDFGSAYGIPTQTRHSIVPISRRLRWIPSEMAPMKTSNNSSSSNCYGGDVSRQVNVLASCYLVDPAASLKGLHYCTTGAAGKD